MADSKGSYLVLFLTLFNFAALVCLALYHVQYERLTEQGQTPTITDVFHGLVNDIRDSVGHRERRDLDAKLSPEARLRGLVEEIIDEKREEILSYVRAEVSRNLREAVSNLRPVDTGDVHGEYRRQVVNTSTANELANIFGEIAQTEVGILAKYCHNDSVVCLPGAKGDLGPAGPKGAAGTTGANGLKGEPGLVGAKGSIGTAGLKGDPGLAGLKGEPGLKGSAGLTGLDGTKGDKGEPGMQGRAGSAGTVGPKGEKGDAGIQGVRGLNGSTALSTGTPCCYSLAVPTFSTQIEQVKVTEGTDVTFNCTPSGFPPPVVTWSPSATLLPASRAFMNQDQMIITNTQTTDTGLITCSAQNPLGNAVKQFQLEVYQHLRFEEKPNNFTVMIGRPVVLECKVDGPLSPAISWYKVMKDGSRIPLTNNITPIQHGSQLSLPSVNPANAGEYVCVGNNGVETIEMSSYLNLFGPPHILPHGVVVGTKGDNVTLKCIADAHPPANYTWTFPPGVTNAYKENDGTLVIINAEKNDNTFFICTATNVYGKDSGRYTVDIKSPAEVTVTPPTIAVTSGVTNIAIECKASGDQPLTVEWMKNGRKITGDGHTFILPGNVLLVNQATAKDIGTYTCRVTNPTGTATASSRAYMDIGTVTCKSTLTSCNQTDCGATCPANCASSAATVIGLKQYEQSSGICKAAIQAGAITDAGGHVVWENLQQVPAFASGNVNGVVSTSSTNPGLSAVFV